MRTGTFGQATIDGPKQSSSWNVDLWDGTNRLYAHVFRGAWKYFYGNIGGLSRPKTVYNVGTLFREKLKYSAMDKGGTAQGVNIGNWSFYGTNPNIYVYRYSPSGNEYASDEIFSTTCHTTHWQLMNGEFIQYWQVNTFIAESWPVGVEWYLTNMEYRSRGIVNYGTETYNISATYQLSYPLDRAYQYWPLNSPKEYSSIFINLCDNFNENVQWVNSSIPNDQVTGYTLAAIESKFLKHVYGQASLKEELKNNKPSGVTDAQIDLLMNSY